MENIVEKAILTAGIKFAAHIENFLEENGVNPGNIKKYDLIQKQNKKQMEIILKKRPNFILSLFGKKWVVIAKTFIDVDSIINDLIDKMKEENKNPMGTAVEDINAGDLVELDPKNGQIKKAKAKKVSVPVDAYEKKDLEKPLNSKKAKNEKNTSKKNMKKKTAKAKPGIKWKDSI